MPKFISASTNEFLLFPKAISPNKRVETQFIIIVTLNTILPAWGAVDGTQTAYSG